MAESRSGAELRLFAALTQDRSSDGARPGRSVGGDERSWWQRCCDVVRGEPATAAELARCVDSGHAVAGALHQGALYWPGESRGTEPGAEGPALSAARALADIVLALEYPYEAEARLKASMARWRRARVLPSGPAPVLAAVPGADPKLEAVMGVLGRLAEDPAAGYVQLILLALTRSLVRPAPRVPVAVVFGGGEGSSAKLTLSCQPGGPAGLYPDPQRMAFLASDDDFAASLGEAWATSLLTIRSRCVTWDIIDDQRPCNNIVGESLAAAFGVGLQELHRRMRPGARWQIRRLDPRCAITGGLDRNGRLLPVGGYPPKLRAAEREKWALLVPQNDPEPARHTEIKVKVRQAADLRDAVRRTRVLRSRRTFFATVTAVVLALAVTTAVAVSRETRIQTNNVQGLTAAGPDIPLQILTGLAQYEKGATTQSAGAVAAAAAVPLLTSFQTPAQVNSLAFSPNGETLASSDVNGQVFLNDPATGSSTSFAPGSIVGPVNSIAFSPDGTMLAGGNDNLVFLAHPAAGTMTGLPVNGGGTPTSVAFSPDSKTLAIGTYDGPVILQNLEDGSASTLETGGRVSSLAFSPDGTTLAIGGADGQVSLHHFHHFIIGENTSLNYDGQVTSVAFSPDGTTLATGDSDGQVFLRDFATGANTTLKAGGSVSSVAFSPDGRILAVGDSDGQVFLDDTATGASTSLNVGSGVGSVAFSHDGTTLATAGASQIELWAVDALMTTLSLEGNATTTAFSADSKLLASGNAKGQIVIDDLVTGAIRTLGNGSQVNDLAFSPDGKFLASGDKAGMVLYNLAAGTSRTYNYDYSNPVNSVAFSPDGTLLAVGDGDDMYVVTLRTGKAAGGWDLGETPNSMAYRPDGKLLVSGATGTVGADNSGVFFLDPRTAAPDHGTGAPDLMPDSGSPVSGVAFSPDGKILASGDAAGNVILYNFATRKLTTAANDGSPVTSVAYSPDGHWLATGTAGGEVILRNLDTGKQLAFSEGTDVTSLAFSPDGRWLASTADTSGNQNQQVSLYPSASWTWTENFTAARNRLCREVGAVNLNSYHWDADFPGLPYGQGCPVTATPAASASASAAADKKAPWPAVISDTDHQPVTAVAFSPDGKTLAEADAAGVAYRWGADAGGDAPPDGIDATSVAFSPDGQVLAIGDSSGNAYLSSGAEPALADPGSKGVTAVAFSPAVSRDAPVLASGDANGHAYLWDTLTGGLTYALADPGSKGVTAVAFSPSGQSLASGDGNGHAYLWDAATGKLTRALADPDGRDILDVAFSPDGRTVAAGDGGGRTYLWSAATGRLVGTVTDPGGDGVKAVAFSPVISPQGQVLAAGDSAGRTYLWKTATGRLLDTVSDPSSDGVNGVAFSPDGKFLAIGDANAHVYVTTLASLPVRPPAGRVPAPVRPAQPGASSEPGAACQPGPAPTPRPAPAPAVQLAGTQLAPLLLPASLYPCSYSDNLGTEEDSGPKILSVPYVLGCSDVTGGVVGALGSSAEADRTLENAKDTGEFTQGIYQFADPTHSASFFAQVKALFIRCFRGYQGVASITTPATVDGNPAFTEEETTDIGVRATLYVLRGVDVFFVGAYSSNSHVLPAGPSFPGLITRLIANVANARD